MSEFDLSKRRTMGFLKDKADLTEENVTVNAKRVIKGIIGLFVTIFTGLFGAMLSQTGNVTVAFLAFGTIVLATVFLFFYIKSRNETTTLKKDQLIMAKSQLSIVDTMNDHFKAELTKTMKFIEGKYSDTILGLTCQINDLVREMCEEREKLHTLITAMTTEYSNGIENMTTEE